MIADLQPLVSLIRIFPEGGQYGDPYTYCATIRHLDRETVEIIGALRAPTPSEWRAIRVALADAGVTKAMFMRIKDGIKSHHHIPLAGSHGRTSQNGDQQSCGDKR